MNQKNTLLSIICIILILACTASYAKIIFATTGKYAPFSKMHSDNKLYGLDIDLAQEICRRTQTQCIFKTDTINNMIASLKAGKYDAWISAITVTEERKKEITFSNVYFSGTAQLLATKNSTFSATPIEMNGKTIGIEDGTNYIPYIKSTYGDTVKIQIFPTRHDACAALKDGKIDAVIDDANVLENWRFRHECKKQFRKIDLPAKYLNLTTQQYAIAVAKNNNKLIATLNQALAAIKADGTYNNIYKKHFS